MSLRRTHTLLGASALGLALAAATALPAVAGDGGPTVTKDGSTYTLKVLETDNGDGDTFIPKGGEPAAEEPDGPPNVGDGFGFAAVLTQDGTKVGTDRGTCTVLSIDLDAGIFKNRCLVTLTFANGTLSLSGDITFSEEASTFKVPITSGTGDFAGANGAVTVREVESSDDGGPDVSDLTAAYTLGGSQVAEVPMGGAAAGGGLSSSTDTALLIGIGGLAAVAGLGTLTGGALLARRRT